jgi:hypothetical protein
MYILGWSKLFLVDLLFLKSSNLTLNLCLQPWEHGYVFVHARRNAFVHVELDLLHFLRVTFHALSDFVLSRILAILEYVHIYKD